MKKKVFIASLIILLFFIIILLTSLKLNSRPINQKQTEKITQENQEQIEINDFINAVYREYPWYGKMPIVTDEYSIAYNFEKESFRIILLTSGAEEIKQAALNNLENIGVNLDKYQYYFIEPKSGFENLLN